MLTHARFVDFMNLRDLEVSFTGLTVLVGPNGAGKTAVLRGLHLLGQLAQPLEWPGLMADHPARLVRTGRRSCILEGHDGQGPLLQVELDVLDGEGRPLVPLVARSSAPPPDGEAADPRAHAARVLEIVSSLETSLLFLEPAELRRDGPCRPTLPRVESSGWGWAGVLYHLERRDPEIVAAIHRDLWAVFPHYEGLWVRSAEVFPGGRFYPVVTAASGESVPCDQVGNGVLRVVALLTALHTPWRPRLLLVDSIDRGLHPQALTALGRVLGRFRQQAPSWQLVCSACSPIFVDEVAVEDVRVLALRPDGSAACRPLADQLAAHPKSAPLLGAGELWAATGEGWVLAGDAPA